MLFLSILSLETSPLSSALAAAKAAEAPEIENIFENSDFIYLLNQASGDRKILCERLNISSKQAGHISNSNPGEGILIFGNVILPFINDFPRDNELYRIMTTKPGEVVYSEN